MERAALRMLTASKALCLMWLKEKRADVLTAWCDWRDWPPFCPQARNAAFQHQDDHAVGPENSTSQKALDTEPKSLLTCVTCSILSFPHPHTCYLDSSIARFIVLSCKWDCFFHSSWGVESVQLHVLMVSAQTDLSIISSNYTWGCGEYLPFPSVNVGRFYIRVCGHHPAYICCTFSFCIVDLSLGFHIFGPSARERGY